MRSPEIADPANPGANFDPSLAILGHSYMALPSFYSNIGIME